VEIQEQEPFREDGFLKPSEGPEMQEN